MIELKTKLPILGDISTSLITLPASPSCHINSMKLEEDSNSHSYKNLATAKFLLKHTCNQPPIRESTEVISLKLIMKREVKIFLQNINQGQEYKPPPQVRS
jgi:hypothetical protein